MRRTTFLAGLLFLFGITIGLGADDMPLSHNLADFQSWGTPVDGLSAGVHIVPLATPEPWPDGFYFQVAIKNDSPQLRYAFITGMHHGIITLTAIDSAGHEYPLREKPGTPMQNQPPVPIAPGTQYFNVVFVHQDEFAATGGNKVVAVISLCDKPSRIDPQAHTTTIRTASFQICAAPPTQTTLPADPMMAQWKVHEGDLLDKLNKATDPNDRSEAAESLASFYITYYGDFDKARALLPQVTDPIDNFDVRLTLVTQNPNLTPKQQLERLELLVPDCPPKRQAILESMIAQRKYPVDHPPNQK